MVTQEELEAMRKRDEEDTAIWAMSQEEAIRYIDSTTANKFIGGVPYLAVECFRSSPNVKIVHALLHFGADPRAMFDGMTILDKVNNSDKVPEAIKSELAGWTPPVQNPTGPNGAIRI